MKSHKKLVIILSVIALLVALATVWYVRYNQENDRKTAALLAVANQFKAPADWTLASETIHEAKPGCIDVRCPSVGRTWEFDAVDPKELGALLEVVNKAGWTLGEKTGCDEEDFVDGSSVHFCYQRGLNQGHVVTFILKKDEGGLSKAILTVD
jgi:hypothetical protein